MAGFTPLNNCLELIWLGNYIREMDGKYMLETSYLFKGVYWFIKRLLNFREVFLIRGETFAINRLDHKKKRGVDSFAALMKR